MRVNNKGSRFVGYVFQFEDALHYDDWFSSEPGQIAAAIEKDLLQRLWSPNTPQTVLEVGCGTGLFLEWFAGGGHQVTGLDPSPYMLNVARRRLPQRIALDRGYAEDLPYEDNAFDTVALITTLEFVNDPYRAIEEALRVARRHVLLGTLNKYSITTGQHCLSRLWKPSVFSHARFFSVFQLQYMFTKALNGPVPVRWQTCLFFPLSTLRYLKFLERSRFLHWLPFGHFMVMRIDLRYTLRTVQQPVFREAPSGAGHAQLRTLCWRSPQEEASNGNPLYPARQILKNTGKHSTLSVSL
jgi:ubiquinone/menaquinone biosynthesis C-methylase UbiE